MRAAFLRIAPIAFLGVVPLVVFAIGVYSTHHKDNVGIDFRYELYPEAKLVLHGVNPFPSPHADLTSGQNRIFPIPGALLVAPLTALSASSAAAVFCLVLLALLALTLRVLEVRDWRVYGLVALWPPAISAVQTGNLTIVLALLVALAWRARERAWLPGILIGVAIALKLFLWPLLVWLLALRRFRATAAGAAIGLAGGVLLVLPFESLGDYVRLLNNLGEAFGRESYNLVGLLTKAHAASRATASAVADVVGLAVLALAYVRRSLTLALAASLVLSPIVWNHYFVLLVIPLAIRWPRLALPWCVPLAMWMCPGTGSHIRLWHVVVGLAVLATTTVLVEWRRRSQPAWGSRSTTTLEPS